jgi:hypothetical protein
MAISEHFDNFQELDFKISLGDLRVASLILKMYINNRTCFYNINDSKFKKNDILFFEQFVRKNGRK